MKLALVSTWQIRRVSTRQSNTGVASDHKHSNGDGKSMSKASKSIRSMIFGDKNPKTRPVPYRPVDEEREKRKYRASLKKRIEAREKEQRAAAKVWFVEAACRLLKMNGMVLWNVVEAERMRFKQGMRLRGYKGPRDGTLSECDVAPFATFGKANSARWARIQERWTNYSDLAVDYSCAHQSTAVVTPTSAPNSAYRRIARYSRHNPLRFDRFERLCDVCVVPIRREVEWRHMYEGERVIEDLCRVDSELPWVRREWKVSYKRIMHTSSALTFKRDVEPMTYYERRWNWSDGCMHRIRLPAPAEKYGGVPCEVTEWVGHKLNFLLEEAYQAARMTAAIARSQVEGELLEVNITLGEGTLIVPLNINRLVTSDDVAEQFPAAFIEVCIVSEE